MIKIENRQVYSTENKTIRRKGSDVYFRRGYVLTGDTPDDFEEVDAVPAYTKAEYDARVEALIAERYTTGQEIQFAREKEEAGDKYTAYLAYVEECKRRAVEELTASAAETLKIQ